MKKVAKLEVFVVYTDGTSETVNRVFWRGLYMARKATIKRYSFLGGR